MFIFDYLVLLFIVPYTINTHIGIKAGRLRFNTKNIWIVDLIIRTVVIPDDLEAVKKLWFDYLV